MRKDYKVGYGKPPKEHRFKPGESGNLAGRPPGRKSIPVLLEKELGRLVSAIENGRERRLSKRELIVRVLINKAVKGDLNAIKLIQTIRAAPVLDDLDDVEYVIELNTGTPESQERVARAFIEQREAERRAKEEE
jgi:hypothetical protein